MKTTSMDIELDEDMRERLKLLSIAKNKPLHRLIDQAILEYLEKGEAYEREKQEDLQRWQRYQDSGEHLSQEEMKTLLVPPERKQF